jgi:hypothetical protein
MAGALAVVATGACFLLKLAYWNWLGLPIGLEGGLFFMRAVPCVFALSFPYAMLTRWMLCRRGVTAGLSQFSIAFGIGASATVLILAIIFPCDAQPYFVSGYLLRNLFH